MVINGLRSIMEPKYTNRLIHETSPYLLQHAHNPVDWYPWGNEALTRAKKEDKPILLSIGYSSCHWCHVMEKESFENEAIANLMNERFINIKVDREERPDLDELYMNVVQMMTGSGGWPMTIFLTPDLVPFHAGTYFPPEDRMGIIGFPKILTLISTYYHTHREEVRKITTQVRQALTQMIKMIPSQETLNDHVLLKAFESLEKQFDPFYGGFGNAPKFPNGMVLSFLLRYWKWKRSKKALEMVEKTLEMMTKGGIHDHLGGGFHRYSVDARWLIPHFEKMLYDQALLSRSYFEAYQATQKERYLQVGERILNYVLREMRDPKGGFYSTQDADSEGREGKFYLWSKEQIKKILGKERGTPFCTFYGVANQGNFEGEDSVLAIASTPEKISKLYGIPLHELEGLLAEGIKKLFIEREKRTKPNRDEKILTSWNALMISSFIEGYKVSGRESYLNAAIEAAHFILQELVKEDHLMRVFQNGKVQWKAYAEDYAFWVQALIDLYEATFNFHWLERAEDFNRRMILQFWDEENGGFFFSGRENEVLIARSKNPYDNAIPSANSVALFNLIKLGYLTGDEILKQKADQIVRLFYRFLDQSPIGFTQMLSGLFLLFVPEEIGLMGPKNDLKTKSMAQVIFQTYLPNKIFSFKDPQEEIKENWLPFLKGKGVPEIPTAFVCKGLTCFPPVTNELELKRLLTEEGYLLRSPQD